MSPGGTNRYRVDPDRWPPRVTAAVREAIELDFEFSVHPATGALLAELAASLGPGALIGETGTGTGVGVAWMAGTAPADSHIVSIELDPDRAAAARRVHQLDDRIEILTGDASELWTRGPFDLLVLDGGPGSAKDDAPAVDPERVLSATGTIVIDDFSPTNEWPPMFEGQPDRARLHWLEHPALQAVDRAVADDMAVVVAARHARA